MSEDWAGLSAIVDPPLRRWASDPVRWASEKLGLELWSAQQEILRSVRDNKLTAVRSCHETGKASRPQRPYVGG